MGGVRNADLDPVGANSDMPRQPSVKGFFNKRQRQSERRLPRPPKVELPDEMEPTSAMHARHNSERHRPDKFSSLKQMPFKSPEPKAGIMVTFDPLSESIQQNLPAFVQHNEVMSQGGRDEHVHESFKGGSEFITMPTGADSTNLEHTPASVHRGH